MPGSLVAVALGVIAVVLFGLDDHGVDDRRARSTPGCRRSGCRTRRRGDYLELAGVGGGASPSSASPRASARRRPTPRGEHYEIDPNRELIGLGAANLGAGLCSGMVVNGSLSKTAVNGGAGAHAARSPAWSSRC